MGRAIGCDRHLLDALILSDGYMEKGKNSKNPRLQFSLKHKEFAKNIMAHLSCLTWEKDEPKKRIYFDKRVNKEVITYFIRTRAEEKLLPFYERWYNDEKIVPEDIEITKNFLTYWYLGDGFLGRKKSRPNYRRIGFCTDLFSEQENEFLASKLKELLNTDYVYLENTSKKKKNIMISRTGVTSFYKFVGAKSPVKCYNYKFDFGQYKDENYLQKSYDKRRKS